MLTINRSTLQAIGLAAVILVVVVGVLLAVGLKEQNVAGTSDVNAVSISGDTQIIDLTAKGGYWPGVVTAQANMETVLRISTTNTFDCSSALTIPALGVYKNLPPTGMTEIEIPVQAAGEELTGSCSMGMYHFKIKFV